MIHIDIKKQLHGSDGLMDLCVSLEIEQGEFLALSGSSGSGKTSFLRSLAGLEKSTGTIEVDGKIWQNANNTLSVQERNIGFVFQDYALFDNMNVEQNLLFVKKDKVLCARLLEMTGLSALKKRKPQTLSGGQKQRVSLCRTMMQRPQLLLLDEPLSALDAKMRSKLQGEILSLHKEFGTTTIMVSHDPIEIYKLSSRVIVLEQGKVINDSNPKDALLKQSGSQKFSFSGEVLDIKKVDVISIAVIAIGGQLVEVVMSDEELKSIYVGKKINVSTKAFVPIIR